MLLHLPLQWQHLAAFDGGGRGSLSTAELEHAIATLAEVMTDQAWIAASAQGAALRQLFMHACSAGDHRQSTWLISESGRATECSYPYMQAAHAFAGPAGSVGCKAASAPAAVRRRGRSEAVVLPRASRQVGSWLCCPSAAERLMVHLQNANCGVSIAIFLLFGFRQQLCQSVRMPYVGHHRVKSGRGTYFLCRVNVRDLVLSPVMAELLQLPLPTVPPQGGTAANLNAHDSSSRDSSVAANATDTAATVPADTVTAATTALAIVAEPPAHADAMEDASWFAPATAARLVELYSSLDADGQGLTPDDLIRCRPGQHLMHSYVQPQKN